MNITVLKSKIHWATVTESSFLYEGSISIDEQYLKMAGIREFEKVLVCNLNNGLRYETYAIMAKSGSKTIGVNGAGARYSIVGDRIIIMAFATIKETEKLTPKVIVLDEQNKLKSIKPNRKSGAKRV